ncbi:MAG: restriction endonuclease subunit S [Aphanizomenon gracile PMC649.10]|nr:restriction endonuclease subunit S [Aphanizomenon gracile PMC649.10]
MTNKKNEDYKNTELRYIPESWKVVKFEEVLNLFNGYAFKSTDAVESSNTQLIRMGNLYQNKLDLDRNPVFYPDSYAQKYSKYILKEGDLIISLTGTSEKEDYGFTVKINKTDKKLLLNQRVARIDVISANVNGDYIFYFLRSRIFLNPLYLTAKGMKQANLSTNTIKKLNVLIPPLEEQRKIARVLSLVQDAIAQQEQLITLTTELKKALMQKLFTEGTRNEPQKMTEIGLIPESWKLLILKDLCLVIVDCPHSTPKFQPNGVRCVKNVNLRDGFFVDKPAFFTSEEDYKERIKRCEPQENDVLFSREAPVGEACLVPKGIRMSLGQRMMLIRTNPDLLNSSFLVYLFYSPSLKKIMQSLEKGATAKHLNVADVKNLKIPIPTINEQTEICSILTLLDAKWINATNQKKFLTDLFRTLLHQLMTAQIRVDDLNLSALNLEPQGGNE